MTNPLTLTTDVKPLGLVVQDDAYNAGRLGTTIVAVITSNTAQAAVAGNGFVPPPRSSVPPPQ